MLISTNVRDKTKSIYMCDRCKREITLKEKVAIYTSINNQNIKKRYDLCNKCYKALKRGISKRKAKIINYFIRRYL